MISGHALLVEIAVTHFIDEKKLRKIKAKGLSTVEIDLSKLRRNADWDMVKSAVLDGKRTIWKYNSAQTKVKAVLSQRLKQKVQEENRRLKTLLDIELARQATEKEKLKSELGRLQLRVEKALERYRDFRTPELQRSERCQNTVKAEQHKLWPYISSTLGVDDIDSVPEVIIHENSHELLYCCDKLIWQAALFTHYVYNKKGSVYGGDFRLEKIMSEWLKGNGVTIHSFYRTLGYARYKGVKFDDKDDRVATEYDVLSDYILSLQIKGYLIWNGADLTYRVDWDKPIACPDVTGEFRCTCRKCGYQVFGNLLSGGSRARTCEVCGASLF